MILNASIFPAMLVLACFALTGLCQSEVNQVAWLKNSNSDHSISIPTSEASSHDSYETQETIAIDYDALAPVDELVSSTAEKRDPRKRPYNNNNVTNNTQSDNDSGTGKLDISIPIFICVGVTILAAFLQH